MRSLNRSKKKTHHEMKCSANGLPIAYRTLLRKLRDGRIGVSVAAKRVDVCSVCHNWKNIAAKKFEHFYNEAEKFCLSECPVFQRIRPSEALPGRVHTFLC